MNYIEFMFLNVVRLLERINIFPVKNLLVWFRNRIYVFRL